MIMRLTRGRRSGSDAPVESLDCIDPLLIPVRAHASPDFNRRPGVAVGAVVVVESGQNLDRFVTYEMTELGDSHFQRANAEDDQIYQVEIDPSAHIQSVKIASGKAIGDACRE